MHQIKKAVLCRNRAQIGTITLIQRSVNDGTSFCSVAGRKEREYTYGKFSTPTSPLTGHRPQISNGCFQRPMRNPMGRFFCAQ